jgi:hypothetical protein
MFCLEPPQERLRSNKPLNRTKVVDRYYEGDSNENLKSAIKIKKAALLSCKLTIMILMV